MYKKILIPVDGSHRAALAAEHGVELASKFQAEVTLFHVIPALPAYVNKYGDRLGNVYQQINDELQKTGQEILEKAKKDLAGYGVPVEIKIIWGNPAQEICNEVKEGRYDLLILGSRGLGEIKGYLMGSVSNRVSRHAPCPVLIVR